MAGFRPITKQAMNQMNTGFSLFCTEEKSKSTSPARKIFRAKRRGNNKYMKNDMNMNNNQTFMSNDDIEEYDDAKFNHMKESQFMEYQKQTMPQRMKRKRKFGVFSSGSNSSLNDILSNSATFRVPHNAMFYVRVKHQSHDNLSHSNNRNNTNSFFQQNNNDSNHNNKNISKSTLNAFELMFNGSKAMNKQNKEIEINNNDEMKDDDVRIFYPEKEECLITRCIRISSEWITAYNSYDFANNIAWNQFNVNGRIHEYQINQLHGIILLNLGDIKEYELDLKSYQQDIQQWVLDHGYSGFIMNESFYLYQPHLYWNLLDDHKTAKVKQTLISDMFQSTKSSKPKHPKHSPWKMTY